MVSDLLAEYFTPNPAIDNSKLEYLCLDSLLHHLVYIRATIFDCLTCINTIRFV